LAESTQAPQPAPGQGAPPQGDFFSPFLMIGAMIVIFWLFFIRPESKRRKEKENLLGSLKVKDKVITIGGLSGTVAELDGDEVILLVDPKKDVKLRFRRSAIDSVARTEETK
jgi:preprotein translocase subunit YajC